MKFPTLNLVEPKIVAADVRRRTRERFCRQISASSRRRLQSSGILRHALREFLTQMELGPMVPDNELTRRGMCLAEYGRQYFIFLPEGGNDIVDLATVKPSAELSATWMDIFSGEQATAAIKNPLPQTNNPCAIYVRSNPGDPGR